MAALPEELRERLGAVLADGVEVASLRPPDSRFQTLERRLVVVGDAAARALVEDASPALLPALVEALADPGSAWTAWVLLAVLTRHEEKLVECFSGDPDWWDTLGHRCHARWSAWLAAAGSLRWCGERGCFLPEDAVLAPAAQRISLAILLKKAHRLGRAALDGLSVGQVKRRILGTLKRLGALDLDFDPDTCALYSPRLELLPAEERPAEEVASQGLLLVGAPAAVKEREPGNLRPIPLGSGLPRFTQRDFARTFKAAAPPPRKPRANPLAAPKRATDRFLNAPPAVRAAPETSALDEAEIEVACCLVGLTANVRLKIRTRREKVTGKNLRKVMYRALKPLFTDELALDDLLALDERRWAPAVLEWPLRELGPLMFVASAGKIRLTAREPGWYALPLTANGKSLRARLDRIKAMHCSLELEIPRRQARSRSRKLRIFHCPCGRKLAARPEHAGKRTVCPECRRKLRIPAQD